MTEISIEKAIMLARSRVCAGQLTPAHAWRVQRIDRSNAAYYLIVFGREQAATAVAAVNTVSGEVETWANLPGTKPHLTILADSAIQSAGFPKDAQAELVWKPCQISLSQLYPVWQIRSGAKTAYVDQQGGVWKSLKPASPGA